MRQRAMIAMAICNDPKLLIADEPTTALDVTVQAQVMEVLHDVQAETGSAMMLITHDLGLVAGAADRVQVMYASRLMETGNLDDIFYESRNPYTMALLKSIPDLEGVKDSLDAIPGNPPSLLNPCRAARSGRAAPSPSINAPKSVPGAHRSVDGDQRSRCHLADDRGASSLAALTGWRPDRPILRVRDLFMEFPIRAGVAPSGGLGSGCERGEPRSGPQRDARRRGRIGLRQEHAGTGAAAPRRAHGGTVMLGTEDVTAAKRRMRELRRDMQMVFQDPYASLNPRLPIRDIIGEPMKIHGVPKREARSGSANC